MPKQFSFGREHRLSDKRDIQRLSKSGTVIKSESFLLKFFENDVGINRICFSISGKIATSPQRNRVRRLFREIFRINKKTIPQGFDYMFIFNRKVLSKPYAELENEFIASVLSLQKMKK